MGSKFTLIVSKNEFEERDGKIYHKVLAMKNSKDPVWWGRVEELKAQGQDDYQITRVLDNEGHKTATGKRITVDTIRNRRANRTKG